MRLNSANRIYSDKLTPPTKPVGSKMTDEEWKEYLKLFPYNGWGSFRSEDTHQVENFYAQCAKNHPDAVKNRECLVCGKKEARVPYYVSSLGVCKTCRQRMVSPTSNHVCKPPAMMREDLANMECCRCGRKGVYSVESCLCKSCQANNWDSKNKTYKASEKGTEFARKVSNRLYKVESISLDDTEKLAEVGIKRHDFGFGIK